MKIQNVYSADDVIEFCFFRRDCPPECDDCGEDDREWQDEADRDAA
jgi:hypothetical protein